MCGNFLCHAEFIHLFDNEVKPLTIVYIIAYTLGRKYQLILLIP